MRRRPRSGSGLVVVGRMSSPAPRRARPAVRSSCRSSVAALSAVLAAQMIARDAPLAVPLRGARDPLLVPRRCSGAGGCGACSCRGDVERIIGTWAGSIDRVAHGETMAPLLQATAYASYGWVEAAQARPRSRGEGAGLGGRLRAASLRRDPPRHLRGRARGRVRKAEVLEALPCPSAGPLARRRISVLRRGLAAMARAFAHASRRRGRAGPRRAPRRPRRWSTGRCATRAPSSPSTTDTRRTSPGLLAGAPAWPAESAFHAYHEELLARAVP